MALRQPIVGVLGHVDHGKTSLLDCIRGSAVASGEPGFITQHIGATEVPLSAIVSRCGPLVDGRTFRVPGLLFIDTPGHEAFQALRRRGGALADLGVLVIDIMEGFRPQTHESVRVLKARKRPFLIALNKVDLLNGWRKNPDAPFLRTLELQHDIVKEELDSRLYKIVQVLFDEHGLSAERYDRVTDFTKSFAAVPLSAKTGEGVADLLLMLIGLAQRFLEEGLSIEEEGPGEGTILEVKEEKGHGITVDAIIYRGVVRRGDTIVVGGRNGPIFTRVKALLRPAPLEEIRATHRFRSAAEVTAAAGIKVSAPGLEEVVPGAPLRVVRRGEEERMAEEVKGEMAVAVETVPEGLLVKADALGSLEALAYELKAASVPVRKAEVGDVARRDVVDAAAQADPLHRAIIGFNVKHLPGTEEELSRGGVTLLAGDIIYKLVEDYKLLAEKVREEVEMRSRIETVFPATVKILPGCVFRVSKPAIVGVRVLAGRIVQGRSLVREDGQTAGKVRSIRSGEEVLKEAVQGKEVAVAIEGPTVGRQIHEEDILMVDVPEADARRLLAGEAELTFDEKEALQRLVEIRRRTEPFWGR